VRGLIEAEARECMAGCCSNQTAPGTMMPAQHNTALHGKAAQRRQGAQLMRNCAPPLLSCRSDLETRVSELRAHLRVRPANTTSAYYPLQEKLLVRSSKYAKAADSQRQLGTAKQQQVQTTPRHRACYHMPVQQLHAEQQSNTFYGTFKQQY
jgi:hypothetical protein